MLVVDQNPHGDAQVHKISFVHLSVLLSLLVMTDHGNHYYDKDILSLCIVALFVEMLLS